MKQLLSIKTLLPALLLFLAGCSAKKPETAAAPPPEAFPVVQISQASTTTYSDYPASIEGTTDVEIRPQVEGFLEQVLVNEGAYVTAGQPLFRINDRLYREQLNSANSSLSAYNAAITNAQLEIDKLTPLVQNKVVAEIQLKMAQAAYKAAVANAQQAKAAVSAANINLGYTIVRAPVSGYIGRLLKKQGSLVSRAEPAPLTTLSDVHEVHVYFALGETDFIGFKEHYKGNSIEEKIKSLPPVSLILADNSIHPQQGKIDIVDGQFDRTTGAITVRASFPNPQGLLRSGNTGKIRLGLQHPDALLVPQAATVEVQDKIYVYLVSDSNKVNRSPITIIGKTGTDYLVSSGVKVNDKIVQNGLDHLQDGMVITPAKPVTSVALKN
ncbi:efflux RND transporter periplasmic adaptor subunit [Ferruginibacter sp. HRS2-29]|uniref:efflux RND transporter periplasmic adaptor subunit n=1 Tax=Ferruginibacter sp. HRS2-29 TaxID=2487334 RepID=UPI0020CFE04D|nr:efflux RND transporter periplasmic adaptor subunit [Ferruginibacter sp. HRS2-29]MCP9749683.1 efflux RND transporter periplasmic adaptor subunit [Ferruginibacter sp. HRS2-29]